MSQIQLIQGSEAWHEFRKTHIGSSDAPIVMGLSPYKTIAALLEEKITGISNQKEHAGMTRGKELEPIALAKLNNMFCVYMEPAVFEHDEHQFLSASLDGYDPVSNMICEIKCPNAIDHKTAIKGSVPDKYYPQVQHAMLVTGLESIIYASYRDGEIVTVQVTANRDYQEELLSKCKLFHKSMMEQKLLAELDATVDRPDIDFMFESYLDLKDRIKYYEEQLESVKLRIIEACNNHEIFTHRAKIRQLSRATYDYAKICSDYNIDKEPYKKVTTYWDFKERKEKL